ncbi:MAG: LysR family transcriptional regulator [Myxococcales bacterium]|nr:LysR family transcriptional regulator [Myxococcales bacterium]
MADDAIDLNLLRVLDALLATRSVTAAAERLGLSQSATSHALARLRDAMGDALLVRGRGGLVPTARAEAMRGDLADALAAMQRVVARPEPFEPSTARRTFRIASADYTEFLLLPPLMRRLADSAPHVDLVMRNTGAELIGELTRGDCDVGIGPAVSTNDRPGIRSRALFDDAFVCVVRRDHPALGRRWTPERFAGFAHAFIAPRGQPGGIVDDALARLGLTRRVALMVPDFLAAPFVIAQTDLVLTLPERVARAFAASLPLVIVPPPLEVAGFSMMLLWHDRVHDEPGQRWLRERIVDAAQEATPRAPGRTKSLDAARGGRSRRR